MSERISDEELDTWERIVRESTGTSLSEPFGMTCLAVIREIRERRAADAEQARSAEEKAATFYFRGNQSRSSS